MSTYEFESKVRYSECGEDCRLNLIGAVNYFQDAATFQGEELGIGIPYLKSQGVAWILTFWQIITERMPKLSETVTTQTWAYDFRSFYGLRNLRMLDGNHEACIWANSVWVLMDMKNRRPVKVPEKLIQLYGTDEKLDMDYAPRKIRISEGGEKMDPFPILHSNLDSNHHVNNGQYIQMAMNYLPDGFKICETRAEYRSQAFLSDIIHPVVCREKNVVTVSLNRDDNEPYAIVRFAQKEDRAQKEERK